jgi:YVTN family beta-propeller protein
MVYIVDTTTLTVVTSIKAGERPRSVAFSSDGSFAFITGENSASLAVVDANAHKVIKMITIPLVGTDEALLPRPMHGVAVIDAAAHTVIKQIPNVGARVWGMALSKDGKKLYTANGRSNDVTVIDLATDTVEKKIGVGEGASPWGVTTTH